MTKPTHADPTTRRAVFRKLHESGCFLIPNPWDVGSARYLQGLGFKALATTSSGFAFSLGRPDSAAAVPLDLTLAHFAATAAASDLPVNADFQAGYADSRRASPPTCALVETGVAGLSIEDSTGDARRPLYDLDDAVARIKAARAAIDASGSGVLLTARAECHLVGTPKPLEESIRRRRPTRRRERTCSTRRVRASVRTSRPSSTPSPPSPSTSSWAGTPASPCPIWPRWGRAAVSVGSALARAAWTGFIQAARMMATGRFDGLEGITPFAELNRFFEADFGKTLQ